MTLAPIELPHCLGPAVRVVLRCYQPAMAMIERAFSSGRSSTLAHSLVVRSLPDRLVEAASFADARTVQRLLAKGAPPNAVDGSRKTALYAASLRPNPAVAELLLKAGADPNIESMGEGQGTPLCGASACGYSQIVAALLEGGADPDQQEDQGSGNSPLLWACLFGHETTARLLLEAGADPNADGRGATPLCAATLRGSLGIVELLLTHGADPQLSDDGGQTVLQIAEDWANRDVEAGLREWAAPTEDEEVRCERTERPDGTELVVVEVRSSLGSRCYEKETGHSRIAELLRGLRPS